MSTGDKFQSLTRSGTGSPTPVRTVAQRAALCTLTLLLVSLSCSANNSKSNAGSGGTGSPTDGAAGASGGAGGLGGGTVGPSGGSAGGRTPGSGAAGSPGGGGSGRGGGGGTAAGGGSGGAGNGASGGAAGKGGGSGGTGGATTGLQATHIMKYGLFCHYVPGLTVDTQGAVVNDPDTLADSFDPTQFANDLASMQVEFVVFTAWHKNMVALWPSPAMAKWLPKGHTTKRDVLADMIAAVKAKGIRVLFYTHPRDGHDFNAADQATAGWTPFNYATWNNFINDVYADLITRYGNQIDGIYLDEGGNNDKYVDYVRLRATVKNISPNLLMIQNIYYDNLYSTDEADQEFDYWGPMLKSTDGTQWQSYSHGVGPVFASNWWSSVAKGKNVVTWSAASMFKYVVLQAGTNTDGLGVQWAAGPYPGVGGGFETGVLSTMVSVGNLIAPVSVSIKGTVASTSYVTKALSSLSTLAWGVATRAPDDSAEYIHVLKPPAGKTLTLPAPADGKLFGAAALVSNGHAVTLGQTSSAVTLTLDAVDNWDANDTPIKVTVVAKRSDLALGKLVMTTSGVNSINNWGSQKVTDGITTSIAGTSMGYSSSALTTTNHTEDLGVDLGDNATVSRVVLWPRTDAPNVGYGFPVDFTIKLSTDNVHWSTVITKTGYPNPGAVPQTFIFPAATARYVRVEGTTLRH